MPFDEDLIRRNRKLIGEFFAERRIDMGHSLEAAAKHIGITANTLSRIEQGKFHWDIDLHLKLCETYEIKPFLVPLEMLNPQDKKLPTFLLCPDPKTMQLFILHRNYPACLIEVVQTTPVSFKIVDLYDFCTDEEIAQSKVYDKVKEFYKAYVEQNQNLN